MRSVAWCTCVCSWKCTLLVWIRSTRYSNATCFSTEINSLFTITSGPMECVQYELLLSLLHHCLGVCLLHTHHTQTIHTFVVWQIVAHNCTIASVFNSSLYISVGLACWNRHCLCIRNITTLDSSERRLSSGISGVCAGARTIYLFFFDLLRRSFNIHSVSQWNRLIYYFAFAFQFCCCCCVFWRKIERIFCWPSGKKGHRSVLR